MTTVAEHDHENACLVARVASIELDEATRHRYLDPDRLERARASARVAFDALVDATGHRLHELAP